MNIINHEPLIKCYGNGFQITFNNKYTVIVKSGIGAKCTQKHIDDDPASMIMASRFGGAASPDAEVEIYNPKKVNVSDKFGEANSLGFVTPAQLVNILYLVSSLSIQHEA
jgi:hypothetical protein